MHGRRDVAFLLLLATAAVVVLARIESSTFEASVAQAEANVERATHALAEAEANFSATVPTVGLVFSRNLEDGEWAGPGTPVVTVEDTNQDLVKTYSGGMRRRLEIARGIIHKPKVLFLDEPGSIRRAGASSGTCSAICAAAKR